MSQRLHATASSRIGSHTVALSSTRQWMDHKFEDHRMASREYFATKDSVHLAEDGSRVSHPAEETICYYACAGASRYGTVGCPMVQMAVQTILQPSWLSRSVHSARPGSQDSIIKINKTSYLIYSHNFRLLKPIRSFVARLLVAPSRSHDTRKRSADFATQRTSNTTQAENQWNSIESRECDRKTNLRRCKLSGGLVPADTDRGGVMGTRPVSVGPKRGQEGGMGGGVGGQECCGRYSSA